MSLLNLEKLVPDQLNSVNVRRPSVVEEPGADKAFCIAKLRENPPKCESISFAFAETLAQSLEDVAVIAGFGAHPPFFEETELKPHFWVRVGNEYIDLTWHREGLAPEESHYFALKELPASLLWLEANISDTTSPICALFSWSRKHSLDKDWWPRKRAQLLRTHSDHLAPNR